ncbi:DUF1109 family protein [Candidatus Parcubacteria bacterium]|nr:MAG: DUF1109 family protein [Candidatus Parcubacteria bacterium]
MAVNVEKLIRADLRRQARSRLRSAAAAGLFIIGGAVALALMMGVGPDLGQERARFWWMAAVLAGSIVGGMMLIMRSGAAAYARWLAALGLGIPVAIALVMRGPDGESTWMTGLGCSVGIFLASMLSMAVLLLLVVDKIPASRRGKLGTFLFLGAVAALGGTLMIHVHCPVRVGSHLAWHVLAAWLGTIVLGWFGMRFHAAWLRLEFQAQVGEEPEE